MKVWKSGSFALGGQVITLCINLGTLAVLGRLLSPEEFGLFGLVVAVQMLFQPILDMGLLPAFLKLEEDSTEASNAFFTVNVFVGLSISMIIACVSPLVADFYEQAELAPLLMTFAVAIFLIPVSGQPQAILNRNKKFAHISLIKIIVPLIGASSVLYLAWIGLGVWALVIRAILQALLNAFLSICMSGRKFKIVGLQTVKKYKESLWFGIQIVGTRIIGGIGQSLDRFLLGKFAGVSAVGYYARSIQLAEMPDSQIRTALTTPALSYLARIKNGARLEHYTALQWLIFLVAGFPCFLLIVAGDWIMPWFMGQQWVEAGLLLQWLGLWGIGKLFHGLGIIFHMNQKQMNLWLRASAIGIPLTFALPCIFLFLDKGLYLFVASYSVSYFFYWAFIYYHALWNKYEKVSIIKNDLCKQNFLLIFLVGSGFIFKYYYSSILKFSSISVFVNISLVAIVLAVLLVIFMLSVGRKEMAKLRIYMERH